VQISQIEVEVVNSVVQRFLNLKEPTPRNPLLIKVKSRESLERLSRWSILKSHDDKVYLPKALAFHYCGDKQSLLLAKESVTLVAHTLHHLFVRDQLEQEAKQYTSEAVEDHARAMYDVVDPDKIKLGLYLAQEFNLYSQWACNSQQTELASMKISDHAAEIEPEVLWDQFVHRQVEWIENQIGTTAPSIDIGDQLKLTQSTQNSKKVFLVHGHNEGVKETVARFLEKIGLVAVILHEQPNQGQTVIEKFEAHSDVGFAVILLTPDEVVITPEKPEDRKPRARQNVILELGYFIGKLGRKRICPLYVEGVELPSDIHGVIYVPYGPNGVWRMSLAKELVAAGIEIDMKKVL
jgi:predicted nucleotide-binding protein